MIFFFFNSDCTGVPNKLVVVCQWRNTLFLILVQDSCFTIKGYGSDFRLIISTNNQSILGQESRLTVPIRGVTVPLHHGVRKRERISKITSSFVYKKQGDFDQLDLGLHFLCDLIVLVLWYRSIPLQQNVTDNINQDPIALILGAHLHDFELRYRYDFTVSELGVIIWRESRILDSLSLRCCTITQSETKDKFILCPTFMKH